MVRATLVHLLPLGAPPGCQTGQDAIRQVVCLYVLMCVRPGLTRSPEWALGLGYSVPVLCATFCCQQQIVYSMRQNQSMHPIIQKFRIIQSVKTQAV